MEEILFHPLQESENEAEAISGLQFITEMFPIVSFRGTS